MTEDQQTLDERDRELLAHLTELHSVMQELFFSVNQTLNDLHKRQTALAKRLSPKYPSFPGGIEVEMLSYELRDSEESP